MKQLNFSYTWNPLVKERVTFTFTGKEEEIKALTSCGLIGMVKGDLRDYLSEGIKVHFNDKVYIKALHVTDSKIEVTLKLIETPTIIQFQSLKTLVYDEIRTIFDYFSEYLN